MTTSEHCYYACLMLILSVSALAFIWSILAIRDASDNVREHELELYEADEKAWNDTYLE